jgi:hypothetical protein
VYELNLEDFSNIDEEDIQEKKLNTTSPNESEKKEVNAEYIKFVLVADEIL